MKDLSKKLILNTTTIEILNDGNLQNIKGGEHGVAGTCLLHTCATTNKTR